MYPNRTKFRKIPLLAFTAGLLLPLGGHAQFIRNTAEKAPEGWQNTAHAESGYYGAEVDRAYELLSDKQSGRPVTVALIGYGIDLSHEDLRPALWTNPREKNDRKDNDRNGLLNDIHGWNFLGGRDGKVLDTISRAADREFYRLVDKYGDYHAFNNTFYLYDEEKDELREVAPPADMQEFNYFRHEVMPDSRVGSTYMGLKMTGVMRHYLRRIDRQMRERFPDKELTKADFLAMLDPNTTDTMEIMTYTLTNLAMGYRKTEKWDEILDYQMSTQREHAEASYQKAYERLPLHDRKVVGDNPYDIRDTRYGNNNLMAENAGLGTLQAGLVGAVRGNGIGIDGVADNARIMTLRIDADFFGEPYMKDMALAIRYAVDHGAEIIQLGKTNTFYPQPWSSWVNEALHYAEQKGVLVIVPVMDLSYNLDDIPFYPNRHVAGEPALTNIITVAASDYKGNPMINANFSAKELDLFAPGVDLISTYLGNTNGTSSGSFLAASMVAGVAALVKEHYPTVTPAQMRQLLIDSATLLPDAEVEKEYTIFRDGKAGAKARDLFLFEELSVSGGILNARKALELAAERF